MSAIVLGIETSCDETSAAVLEAPRTLLGHVVLSQDAHAVYGGVVPEIAARAHLAVLDDVVDGALRQAGLSLDRVDLVGATAGPGLIGALLVGLTWGRSAAYALGRPFVPVHHMEAHLFATTLEDAESEPPFVALLVSGGHTLLLWVPEWGRYELLGETRDDAAGEAFDKVARILGLGYPGGPHIERAAVSGNARAHPFPRPMFARHQAVGGPDWFDFSFSGLKTSVLTRVRDLERQGRLEAETENLAASFQQAVIEVLVGKTLRAVEWTGCDRVVLGGGVSASRALRSALADGLGPGGRLFAPGPRLATDNAAMVARAAHYHFEREGGAALHVAARADLPFPGLVRTVAGGVG